MAIDIVNGSDADITNFGAGTSDPLKRTYTAADAGVTDAQAVAGVQANGATAVLKSNSTAVEKARVASAILDSLVADIDLSTPEKRFAFKLKQGLDEYVELLNHLGA